jgi:glyoxylase-like metal-dependent hydrolase (beta-lactamase superfamily II)
MDIRMVRAPNPGIFTGEGTNTWVVESGGSALIIDPGPLMDEHESAVVDAAAGFDVEMILVTHTHPDHAPLGGRLGERLDAPTAGRAPGPGFTPDRVLTDGEIVKVAGLEVEVIATAGHTPDSTSYRIGDVMFSGDHIMGGSTVLVQDMADYMESLERLVGSGLETIYPGHGSVVTDPESAIAHYLKHRQQREQSILAAVGEGADTVGAVVESVYTDVSPALHRAASISVAAHLRKLADEGLVDFPSSGGGWNAPVGLR